MIKIRIIAAAILLLGILVIFRLIRKRKMELKYALPWLFAALVAVIVDAFPVILFWITDLMGIETPSNALFLIALVLIISLLFLVTVVISRQADRINHLAQTVALNDEQIRVLTKEIESLKARGTESNICGNELNKAADENLKKETIKAADENPEESIKTADENPEESIKES